MGTRAAFDEKNWKTTGASSHGDAAVKALDKFCQKVTEESDRTVSFSQVIFNDLEWTATSWSIISRTLSFTKLKKWLTQDNIEKLLNFPK